MWFSITVKNYYLDKPINVEGLYKTYIYDETNFKAVLYESSKSNSAIIKIGDWKWEIQKYGKALRVDSKTTECRWQFSTNYLDSYVLKVFHPNEEIENDPFSGYRIIQQFDSTQI